MKKLTLKRSTLRQLAAPELETVAGAGYSQSAAIPNNCYASCIPWNCGGPTGYCVPP